ncbi:MAG: YicC family protein [Spirochaetes bacterium]|nr:YicC family protein [Spirochaetota bacterium]
MKSMTGYGYGEGGSDSLHFSLELKSLNNRFLDIYVNLPLTLSPLEPRVREFLQQRIQRGKVEVYIKMKETQEHLSVRVDEGVVRGYLQALRTLASYADTPEEIRLSHLLRLEGILQVEKHRDIEEYWKVLYPLLEKTFHTFDASRVQEGEALEKDILGLIGKIEAEVQVIEGKLPELKRFYTETIRNRMEELLSDKVDEARMLSEVAILLVKYSVNEELVRLKAHLDAFRKILKEEGGIGKKLDFLCQEMNREINTIGSKNVLAEVTRSVVDMKDALENIREQIRNIE